MNKINKLTLTILSLAIICNSAVLYSERKQILPLNNLSRALSKIIRSQRTIRRSQVIKNKVDILDARINELKEAADKDLPQVRGELRMRLGRFVHAIEFALGALRTSIYGKPSNVKRFLDDAKAQIRSLTPMRGIMSPTLFDRMNKVVSELYKTATKKP